MIWAIGDVHGLVSSYEKLCISIRKGDPDAITFQVGDVALGFKGVKMPSLHQNDYFITGNHDDALVCEKSPNYLGEYGSRYINGKKLFFVSGAMSTDKQFRTEGIDWWAYEELNYPTLCNAAKLYAEEKPDIMISHDCPKQIREMVFGYRDYGRTVEALSTMLDSHAPKIWVFGHHHRHVDIEYGGTRFMCLAELQHKKVDP